MPEYPHAVPLEGFLGGLLVGLAAALMLLVGGRIAGVSGLAARALGLSPAGPADRGTALAFVAGLPLGALAVAQSSGGLAATYPADLATLVLGGLLVGYGTRLGSGCTSGHGICGLARLSRRSVVATLTFMATGILTVALSHLLGANA
ncbi:MAG: YeeE/YedE thiosulfate transporter family protein [Sphingomonadaceae bacterium]|uniref:YeeE/YedE family protein n=1 Tax=Thermaurantiacus sp. TaxID=2820283 RepID=UPI00298F1328|nr:YeeE/YedE thiosulfate transporter family protein [Thermaurantiacus sp.]MCS6986148.1 YeeE/YedE thiosulfate transporter family protein [Sphingomonadaceae bacterium]MDW8414626.1 YeeE/YedE thiosulfate transporter family protein [Thermaurantiacus sp.]